MTEFNTVQRLGYTIKKHSVKKSSGIVVFCVYANKILIAEIDKSGDIKKSRFFIYSDANRKVVIKTANICYKNFKNSLHSN